MCKQKQESTCIFNERIASVNIFLRQKFVLRLFRGFIETRLNDLCSNRLKIFGKKCWRQFWAVGDRFELLVTD